jgi:hypothetical protein
VPAAQAGSAYRPWSAPLKPEEVFCFKYLRTVGLDNVVTFANHRLQIEPDPQRHSYARAEVEVHERLDGSLAVYWGQRCLVTSPAPQVAADLRARNGRRGGAQRPPGSQTPSSASCSSLKLPRLSLGSRLVVQRISLLLLGGQLPRIHGASL